MAPSVPGQVLDRRLVRLDAQPGSAGQARRVLREVLRGSDGERWLEAAELACTEVVSNVVLHARTPMELTVQLRQDQVRVEVRDFNPVLPLARSYGSQAMTGRGMALVAALSSANGISDADTTGKTVWFVVSGDPAEQTGQDLLQAWDDAAWEVADGKAAGDAVAGRAVADGTVAGPFRPAPVGAEVAGPAEVQRANVVLLGLPASLWMRAREHHDALLRELALYLAVHDEPTQAAGVDVTGLDLAAGELVRSTLSGGLLRTLQQGQPEQLATTAPAHDGEQPGGTQGGPGVPDALDLVVHVPRTLAVAVEATLTALDVAERLARTGQLLEQPGSPALVAVRNWVCDQVLQQLAGATPIAWTDSNDGARH